MIKIKVGMEVTTIKDGMATVTTKDGMGIAITIKVGTITHQTIKALIQVIVIMANIMAAIITIITMVIRDNIINYPSIFINHYQIQNKDKKIQIYLLGLSYPFKKRGLYLPKGF